MRPCCALPAITLLALGAGLASTEARAQDTPPIAVGERVRVSIESGATREGLVTMVASGAFEVQSDDGGRSSVLLSTVTKLEVSRGQASRRSRGAVIGALAGAVAGAVFGHSLGDDQPFLSGEDPFPFTAGEKAGIGSLLGGAGGAMIGGLIGGTVHSDRWVEVPLERLRVSLSPDRRGRFALELSVRF